MSETYIITRSLDATEWGMTSAIGLASNPSLQTDTKDRAVILVEAFEADTAEEASKRFDEVRNARCADLDSALAEIERMRPVVDAAEAWRWGPIESTERLGRAVFAAIDIAKRAGKTGTRGADLEERLLKAEAGRESYKGHWETAKRRFEKAEIRIVELEAEAQRLRAKVESMRPVVDAAKTWKDSRGLSNTSALFRAVDAYYENSAPAHGAHDQAHQADMEEQLRNAKIGRQSYQESWVAAKQRFEKAEARVVELKEKLNWEQEHTDETGESLCSKLDTAEKRIAELEKIRSTLYGTCNEYERDIADLQKSLGAVAASPLTENQLRQFAVDVYTDAIRCGHSSPLYEVIRVMREVLLASLSKRDEDVLLLDNVALVEALADLEHERWSGWEKYREDQLSQEAAARGPLDESPQERWHRLRETPYAELKNQEQESDRTEARKSIEVMKRHLLPFSKVRVALKAALAWTIPKPEGFSKRCQQLKDALDALPAEVKEALGE